MTSELKSRYLSRIADVSGDINTLRRVEMDLASSGTASATLSSGSGSRSYTHLDLPSVHRLIQQKEAELAALRARVSGTPAIRRIMFTR